MKWMEWMEKVVEWNLWQGQYRRIPEKKLFRLWFVHHKLHMEWTRCVLGTPAVEGEHSKPLGCRAAILFCMDAEYRHLIFEWRYRLNIFENKIIKWIFGSREWRKLHSRNLYVLYYCVRVVKFRNYAGQRSQNGGQYRCF